MGSPRRIEWIDGLRGMSALLVVAHHYLWRWPDLPGNPATSSVLTYANLGTIGVAVFFLISGYIIPQSALHDSDRPVRRFVLSRFFRLYPAYWVAVLFAIFTLHPGAAQALINLTMLQRFVGARDLSAVFWTLKVELVFYVVIAVLLGMRWLRSARTAVIGMILSALASLALACVSHHYNTHMPAPVATGLTLMFAGNLLFWFERGALTRRQLIACHALAGVVLAASFVIGHEKDWDLHVEPGRFIISDALAAGVFLLAWRFWRSVPGPLLWLGSISYSVYLLHSLVELVVMTGTGGWWKVVAALATSLLLAHVCHHLVEKPGIALGRRLQRWGPAVAERPSTVS